MIISEQWIRELVDPGVGTDALAHGLTMAGLKVDAITPAIGPLDGIVAGRVLSVAPHPGADKLTVCEVDSGGGRHRIVCGADNVRAGMLAPLALPGATLPGGTKITASELRGVLSEGMLCSGHELGLSEDHAGLLELADDIAPGSALGPLFGEDDRLLDLDLTPNRGDCLSVLGVAREVAAVFDRPRPDITEAGVKPTHKASRSVRIEDSADCPAYVSRVVRGVDASHASPMWLQEKLRRAGVRPLGAAVDVTAWVMLELGQPMHAFDDARLEGDIAVRRGRAGEALTLLDGQVVTVDADVLVIADATGPVALAGVMGGAASAVGPGTKDIVLESAHFAPLAVAGRARRYGLHTDASLRFERGVDPSLPRRAIERCTRLLVEIAGGEPGPVVETGAVADAIAPHAIVLRRERVVSVLGLTLANAFIEAALARLGMTLTPHAAGWTVRVPAARFDLTLEVDLIEELARLHGYDRIPSTDGRSPMMLHAVPDALVAEGRLTDTLIDRGFQQVITYSFVDPALQGRLGLAEGAVDLANPISSEMAQMRTSLWPGLLAALAYNANRQQTRVRFFETGLRFMIQGNVLKQEKCISGLIWGDRDAPQWGVRARPVDFYDLKADCEALLSLGGPRPIRFEAAAHPTLHPGQTARVMLDGLPLGWIGTLHPAHAAQLDLANPPILFEFSVAPLQAGVSPHARPVSRFPALRRDLALVVPETLSVGDLLAAVDTQAPAWLTERFVFDIYRGKGVEAGLKSVALGLILQETSRTLTDTEVDGFVQGLVEHLGRSVQATLRD